MTVLVALGAVACGPPDSARRRPGRVSHAQEGGDLPPEIASCNRCHLPPPPGILTKDRWPRVLRRMGELTTTYELESQLTPYDIEQATRYYVDRAPTRLSAPDPRMSASPVAFRGSLLGLPPPPLRRGFRPPVIGNLTLADLDGDGWTDVLVSDIAMGGLTWIHMTPSGRWAETVLAEVVAPARVEMADLDGDGDRDLAVASLGSIVPTEDPVGAVVLLIAERTPDGLLQYVPRTVLADVARVCDVRPVDLDEDGDLDLVIAMYGLYKTGGAAWLEQRADGVWERHSIVARNGVSHVPVEDIDGDGRLDVVALVSQEHEEIVLHRNKGGGRFEAYQLFKAPHPMFGLSGCILDDLDGDGDIDVVFTNGDALDQDPLPKPWNGVHWLENTTPDGGRPTFEHHELTRFPGAYCVAAGDLDGDGDHDLAVGSMLNRWADPRRQSLIWLENRGGGAFEPHPLDNSPTYLVTAAIGDLTGDGRNDVVAGAMYLLKPYYRVGRVALWTSLGAPR